MEDQGKPSPWAAAAGADPQPAQPAGPAAPVPGSPSLLERLRGSELATSVGLGMLLGGGVVLLLGGLLAMLS